MVANELTKRGVAVFYDQDEKIAARMWGKDLGDYLDYIYRQGSRFCVMFVSAAYGGKHGRATSAAVRWREVARATMTTAYQLGLTTPSLMGSVRQPPT